MKGNSWLAFNSSFSWYKSTPSSGMSPPPLIQKDADMPRALDRWSHLSPWPLNTRSNFGPKTRMMVVVVESCVRTKPNRYLISGPACGKMKRLRTKREKVKMAMHLQKLLLNSNYYQFCFFDSFKCTVCRYEHHKSCDRSDWFFNFNDSLGTKRKRWRVLLTL